MARHEAERENLMREATALTRRLALQLPDETDAIIAGWKGAGGLSVYFGEDPVYHFDADDRLRRAYVAGCLYRTQGTTLARLTRLRTETVTQLQRHDLTAAELARFVIEMRQHLTALHKGLQRETCRVVEQIPSGASLGEELAAALERILSRELTLAPPIAGKR